MAPPRKRLALFVTSGALTLTLVAGVSPAAANVISPEPPHSPGAEEMSTLYWIGLIAAVLIILAVNLALIGLVRRFRAARGRTPSEDGPARGGQLRIAGGLSGLALVLFILGVFFTERARDVPPSGPEGLEASGALLAQKSIDIPTGEDAPLTIQATSQQWLWRYDYPKGAFSYYRLVVPVDTTVVLELESSDVIHSWFVPELSGKFDAVPGKVNKVVFRADEEGTYEGSSATFSGQGYASMRTEVDVVSPEEYESFLAELSEGIEAAQERVIEAQGGVNDPGAG